MKHAYFHLIALALFGLATTTGAVPPRRATEEKAASFLPPHGDGVHAGAGTDLPPDVKQHIQRRVSRCSFCRIAERARARVRRDRTSDGLEPRPRFEFERVELGG